ncbi:nucleotidyl transferase [Candidatus Micrarchaeota archaeon CG10_big_fil_rev_8_21_14_0_10_59_7]|nr:MAG: nucleotidyl transferase [Candidatus Micrarchaeota archaeon CG10_big_fil_rev_8_21_14_0_10_59_7]
MNTYVVLAAGNGVRLWPITEHIPKVMVRVLGKPMLEWICEGIDRDAEKIVLVVGAKKEKVEEWAAASRFRSKIVLVEQSERLGTGHALLQAEKEIKDDFVVLNGDNFFGADAFGRIASEGGYWCFSKKVEDKRHYGVFETDSGRLKWFVEKPEEGGPGLANLNLMRLPKEFFGYLRKLGKSPRGEYELPDALLAFAKKKDIVVHELETYWSDVGFFWNLLDANAYAAENLMDEKRDGEIEKGAIVKGKVHLGIGSVIKAGTVVQGPCYIGDNCAVGPGAVLRPVTVLEGDNHVGVHADLKNCLFMRGADAHSAYVGDSVVCGGVNLGAGTRTANLRFDEEPVDVYFRDKKVNSGKRKLGCVVGAGTKTGVNTSINCGVLIGENCRIFPGTVVGKTLDNCTVWKG